MQEYGGVCLLFHLFCVWRIAVFLGLDVLVVIL